MHGWIYDHLLTFFSFKFSTEAIKKEACVPLLPHSNMFNPTTTSHAHISIHDHTNMRAHD